MFDRTEATLGEVFPASARLPEASLEMRPPREFLSGSVPSRHRFGAVPNYRRSLQFRSYRSYSWGNISHKRQPSRSLWKRVEFSLGFGTIKIPFRCCSDLLPEVSPVFDRTEAIFLGTYFPHTPAFQRSLWKCVPPVSSLSGSVPSRHIFGAVPDYYRRSFRAQPCALPPMSSLTGLLSPSYLSGRLLIVVFLQLVLRACRLGA